MTVGVSGRRQSVVGLHCLSCVSIGPHPAKVRLWPRFPARTCLFAPHLFVLVAQCADGSRH